jgi:hypothetical protein
MNIVYEIAGDRGGNAAPFVEEKIFTIKRGEHTLVESICLK